MDGLVEMIENLKLQFDNEQQWNRYVEGDILYNVTDEKSANTVNSYVSDGGNDLSVEETHKYFDLIMKAFSNLRLDSIGKTDEKWLHKAENNRLILSNAKEKILERWTGLVFKQCGVDNNKNEMVFVLENLTLAFWKTSAERKGKIIFFPGIHIEIVPFLQSIRVVQHFEQHTDELHEVLRKYPLEYLYQYEEPEEEVEPYDDEYVPDIFVEDKIVAKKKMKKKSTKKGLTNTLELALKTGEKRKKKKEQLSQKTLLSRSPSANREEHIRFNLYSDVTPIFNTSTTKDKLSDGTTHKVDFGTEAFLGPVYHISSFECGKKSQKYGSWVLTLEENIEERRLNGESIMVSLKVPVEEVFMGSSEPVVAFSDNGSEDWRKGVFTTHSQFDQNTFIITTRLSKLGYVSLFQHNDFHYPYKKWHVSFEEDKISVRLHTNVVELAFVIQGSYFHLDTLTGDEFSKLRNLHQKKMSLSEVILKLEKHGVHIVPNSEIINKHRDTKKVLELEIFTYRIICLNQINCESCRMNSTVSNETVVLTVDGTPKNITTKSAGKYAVNFGEAGKKRKIHTNVSTTVSTIACVNQPSTSPASPVISLSPVLSSTTQTFLAKLGFKKGKDGNVNAVSKFLGRDVANPNLIGTDKDDGERLGKNTSDDGKKDSKNSSEFGVVKTIGNGASTTSAAEPATSSPKPVPKKTTRPVFITRVTFRPILTSSTTTVAPISSSSVPSTTTATLPASTSTVPSTLVPETTTAISTTIPPRTPTRRFTPTRSQSSILNTLATATAFPTLLSMTKAVTLPINKTTVGNTGPVKQMKKKIRRIIKRRRNILPSSQTRKVTDKVLEVKHVAVPTPTTSPVRSTLKPDVEEEKAEEISSSGVQCPMDILFVVDSSGSIARTYDTQKDFLTVLIKKVVPSRSHRVGLIQFAGRHIQKMEWSFDTHSKNSQLLSAIRSVRHLTGTTYIGAALELSLILLDSRRKHTETTVILISDGFSQDDSTQQAKLLRQLPNVKMYAISLNKLTNTKYLTDIVGDRKNLFVNDESKWFEEFFTKKLHCVPTRR
ncbi:unnamed protein product [Caenorhabditis sp. 36 PRJEB53466]|nr:unnamed protein product [Caenorhabditis sp. 36 PRJEB53466]